MSKLKLLNIDSRFRKNITDKTSDFRIDLNYPLRNVTEMSLINIEIPRTWFVISKRLGNNKLRFEITGSHDSTSLDNFYAETFTFNGTNYTAHECGNPTSPDVSPVGIWNLEIPFGNYKLEHPTEIYGLYYYLNSTLCTKESTGEKAMLGSLLDISMSANWNEQTNKSGPSHGCTKIECHNWESNNKALTCNYKRQLINILKEGLDITNTGSGTIQGLVDTGNNSLIVNSSNVTNWNASGFQGFVEKLTEYSQVINYEVKFLDIDINPTDMYKHMLWLFGYRIPKELSTFKTSHKSTAIADTTIFKYFYVYLDEGYNSDEAVIGLLKDSYLSNNIFARVQCLADNFKIQTIPEAIMLPRKYPPNGINLNYFKIKILDPYGNIIDLNGADVSLIIELKIKN